MKLPKMTAELSMGLAFDYFINKNVDSRNKFQPIEHTLCKYSWKQGKGIMLQANPPQFAWHAGFHSGAYPHGTNPNAVQRAAGQAQCVADGGRHACWGVGLTTNFFQCCLPGMVCGNNPMTGMARCDAPPPPLDAAPAA